MSTFLVVIGIVSNVARRLDNLSKKSDKELCEIRNKKPCDNEYILRDKEYKGHSIAYDILKSRYPLVEFNNETLIKAVELYKQDTIQAEEKYGPIAFWNVSSVTDMCYMFYSCKSFNADLSNWDVSSVTDMYCMFNGCKSFNADLSNWDVSSVTNMGCVFSGCESFNSDLSEWDVSSVTNMNCVFAKCKSFNCDISRWDVSKVTTMHGIFSNCYMKEYPDWYKK